MRWRLAPVLRSIVLAAALALPLPVQAQAPGAHGRGVAILPPAESPDAPPSHPQPPFTPYYSPLTPISSRWRPVVYVPYYPGYCAHHYQVKPCQGVPYGDGGGLGPVAPGCELGLTGYGGYTGAPRDEARLLHLGGNGPYQPVPPDLLDAIHGGPVPAAPH